MATIMDDVQLEEPPGGVAHHCFSAKHLADMERFVRDAQAYHQAQAEEMARYRTGIVQCLVNHHNMTYQGTAELLGELTRSRVEQIFKGKR